MLPQLETNEQRIQIVWWKAYGKNNFHRPFLRCILSLLWIMTAFPSKGLSFTYSLNYCLPSSIHKPSIWSSPTLPSFKRLLPFLWHNIPCRALKGLEARQSSLWNCLKTHLFISANSGAYFFCKYDRVPVWKCLLPQRQKHFTNSAAIKCPLTDLWHHRLCLTMDSQTPSRKDWLEDF